MKRQNIYKQIALSLVMLFGILGSAWGQGQTEDENLKITEEEAKNITIVHKQNGGIWYSEAYKNTYSRNSITTDTNEDDWLKDTFAEEDATKEETFNNEPSTIQKTHEYIEKVYMFPEDTRNLILPDIMAPIGEWTHLSLYYYQRWYDYTTDKSSEYIEDLGQTVNEQKRAGYVFEFKNGLVGGTFLLKTQPAQTGTPGPFAYDQGIFGVKFTMPENNTRIFKIACDASNYTDLIWPEEDVEEKILEEPTLSQRAIFEIHPASEIQTALSSMTGDSWFQDDTIHFPTISIGKTEEQVALEMAAQNYFVTGETKEDHTDDLSIRISYPQGKSSFLNLIGAENDGTATISEDTRKISFTYNTEGPEDGDIAYIEVTKTHNSDTYNIARFTLIFDDNTVALTQDEVKNIEDKKNANDLYFRTNAYLDSAYTLLTKLDMDYTNVSVGENNNYYPYPINWEYGSYAFYTNVTESKVNHQLYPQWGEYAITKSFPFRDNTGVQPLTDGYHLYVDANEYPGTVCTVPLRNQLCPGATLYITYWMMSMANNLNQNQCDAGVILVLKGIDDNNNETVIHRQASGQIPYNRTSNYTGAPVWNQLYFSFINGDSENKYKRYVLEIQSNNANTRGADFIIDDIRVYMQNPTARVEQQKLTCGEQTRLRMDLSWESLLRRLGLEETEESNTDNYIEFCFIDRDIYESYLEEHANEVDRYDKAVQAATIIIGQDLNLSVGRLYYDLCYKENTEYTPYNQSEDKDGEYGSLAKNNKKNETSEGTTKYFFYKSEDEGREKQLSVDFYADMSQGRQYTMLIRDDEDMEFGYPGGGPCVITTDFYVEGENVIKMNGELIGPDNRDYCKGQIFTFDIDMRYYSEETQDYESYNTENIYYDWFFGSEMAYNDLSEDGQTTIDETSLAEALKALRGLDKEATADETIVDGETKYTLNTTATTLDDKYRTVIEKYLNIDMVASENGLHHQLVLREKNLDIRIMEDGLNLVVTPIDTRVSEEDRKLQLCFEPIPFTLTASNAAPQIQPGFEYVQYENDAYNPAMRIGLQQIKDASGPDAKEITVNLRNAKYALESYESDKEPDHIGLRWNTNEDQKANNPIFLIDSDDPALDEIVHASDFDRTRYIIGAVTELKATPYDDNSTMPDNSMKITFKYGEAMDNSDESSPKFEPKEGYYYTFMVLIEEHNSSHANENGACWGNFNLTMKVVPEYLVWKGTDNINNWNNDANWKRALNDDIKASDKITDYENDNRGYVPMLFSKVIMPEDSKVELYEAYFTGSNDTYRGMKWETKRPDYMESPSTSTSWNDGGHPIQYDMMVYEDEEGNLSTKPYRVNLCDQIHFEPSAEMLHAELLTYNKAWVDYKLESKKWYTLASPLQGVVAGDFYTDGEVDNGTAGIENQEYFTDIYFDKEKYTEQNKPNGYNDNSRFSPSVYQRGWNKDAKMITIGENNNTAENPVAIAGNWSAVYNNVYEEYNPGEGFSVKVLDMPKVEGEEVKNAIFRLPKADPSYSYYSSEESKTTDNTDNFTRDENSGKLQITPANDATNAESLHTITLSGNNDYYLIGNPFMAHLDAAKFFSENSDVLQQKYWTVTNDVQNVAASKDEEWSSTENGEVPTIAPLQSFFVQKTSNGNDEVTFTADMQTLSEKTSDEGSNSLILTVQTADGKMSRAAIAYDMSANKDYAADEDAELFLDSNLSDVPAIYTVAGTMATSINCTSELYNIPVGIYGHSTEMVTLSFEGLKHFSSATLYDAEKKTETPLREGTTLTVPASTSGRYFLRAGTPTGNEVLEADDIQIYTLSGNRVMVTSSTPLKDIRVYNLGGALTKHVKAGVCSFELYLPDGIYIVTAENANGEVETEKVSVR